MYESTMQCVAWVSFRSLSLQRRQRCVHHDVVVESTARGEEIPTWTTYVRAPLRLCCLRYAPATLHPFRLLYQTRTSAVNKRCGCAVEVDKAGREAPGTPLGSAVAGEDSGRTVGMWGLSWAVSRFEFSGTFYIQDGWKWHL